MFTFKKLAAPLAALVLPVLLATSASAQGKMMDHKMSGGKMSGSKMSGGKMMGSKKGMGSMVSVKNLVPTYGAKPSAKELAGAKVVKTTMMMGKPCYTVKLASGKMVQMCRPADHKMMVMHMGGMKGSKMGGMKMKPKMSGKM